MSASGQSGGVGVCSCRGKAVLGALHQAQSSSRARRAASRPVGQQRLTIHSSRTRFVASFKGVVVPLHALTGWRVAGRLNSGVRGQQMLLPQRTRIALLVAIAAFLYYWAVTFGVHVLSAPRPSWWFPSRGDVWSAYSWLHLTHAGGLLLVSAPFAVAIALVRPAHPVRVALAVAVLGIVGPSLYLQAITPDWLRPSGIGLTSAAVDYIKFVSALPLVTWLASRRLPSNNSFKPNPLRGSA